MKSPTTPITDEAFQIRMLKQVSRSFAFTIPQLPLPLIRSVGNAYLMCRIADTIEDDTKLPITQKKHYFNCFNQVLQGHESAEQFAAGLAPLLSDCIPPAEHELIRETPQAVEIFHTLTEEQQTIIQRCVQIMSSGMLIFQETPCPDGLASLKQLDDYCYYVAGVVGEMLTGLFCAYSNEIAEKRDLLMQLSTSFGQGLQMTNILKDIWDDKSRGACWFPQDIFTAEGFKLADRQAGKNPPAFDQGLQTLISITYAHLENALAYTLAIPKHETGIRKFCFWAVGMALCTLKKIYQNRDYTSSRDVTISRSTTRRIVMASNAAIRSNLLLKQLFYILSRGLPSSSMEISIEPPTTHLTESNQATSSLGDS